MPEAQGVGVSRASLIRTTSEFLCMSPAARAVKDPRATGGLQPGRPNTARPTASRKQTNGWGKARPATAQAGAANKENAERAAAAPPAKINVFVRVRPMIEKETRDHADAFACTEVRPPANVLVQEFSSNPHDYLRNHRLKTRNYTFDEVFGPSSSQEAVYRSTAAPLIDHIAGGGNATCFCYGATGAGKTHTMLGTREAPGVMVLTLQELFERLGDGKRPGAGTIKLSYLEIYCEAVRDLLAQNYQSATASSGAATARGGVSTRGASSRGLALRARDQGGADRAGGTVSAAGLSVHEVSSTKDVLELLHLGNGRRTTESTRSNDASSRSHAILQCYIPVVLADGRTKITKLSLIDLAGSERAIATEGRSARSVEGANINKSLLALSSCIHALCEGRKHIPYRNSKLTQLLRDSLGGAAKTVMIANVSPCSTQIGETSNTLHWANRAKEIRAVEVMHDDVSAGPSDGSALFGATACYAADNADLVSVLQARVAALEEENVQLVRERDAALEEVIAVRKRRREEEPSDDMEVDVHLRLDADAGPSPKRMREITEDEAEPCSVTISAPVDSAGDAVPEPTAAAAATVEAHALQPATIAPPAAVAAHPSVRRSQGSGGALRKLMCLLQPPPQSPAV